MKWEIESVVDDEGPTMTVRVLITKDDGTNFVDQRSLPDGSTKEDIAKMCDELCHIHDKPARKDLSYLAGGRETYVSVKADEVAMVAETQPDTQNSGWWKTLTKFFGS